MGSVPVFCTSPNVTWDVGCLSKPCVYAEFELIQCVLQLVNKLNDNCGLDKSASGRGKDPNTTRPTFFGVPVGGKFIERTETAIRQLQEPLQIFEGYSADQLSKIGDDRAAGQNWIDSSLWFAELDEQSTQDDTVKMHYLPLKQDRWVFSTHYDTVKMHRRPLKEDCWVFLAGAFQRFFRHVGIF